ncbi:hypothetical protein HMPREF3104_04865 [Corynebacterium sp. HMSC30G07]|uniref:hypothetical protein n=1 Tax=Corynebacterium sp. HMSC30G07 TaxID=1581072 RepID=UPI0008A437DA|nr:hypothetical protein [Corynebacterium sp. HMSC30G07]OFT76617.1 hypothetical protein HMPREF3104_04865 [Corynebacterium sp. HMSC30G07]
MDEELLALNAWREQALSRGIDKQLLPSAFELGTFLRAKNDPEKWQDKPTLAMWGDSLTKLLQAVATGNFVKGTPLPDLFFKQAAQAQPAPQRPAQPAQPEPEPVKPEPEPAQPEPAKPQPQPARQEQSKPLNLRAEDFAERDVWTHPEPLRVEGGEVMVRARGDEEGTLEVSWVAPESGAKVRIFRLLSRDSIMNDNELEPNFGLLRTITAGRLWTDEADMDRAIRSYHVWLNEGDSEIEALRAEPKLVGVGVYVQPVHDLHVTFEDGRIYGSYAEIDGTESVEIFLLDNVHGRVQQFENENNLRGFQLTPKSTGRAYVFQARRKVGVHMSAYSDEQAVDVPAELTQITPQISLDGDRFTLSWDRPGAGEVRIYRSAEPVADGAAGQLVDADNLGEYGLQVGDWSNRLEPRDATEFATDWKSDAYSMYITAVNVVENQAMIGTTASWVRCGEAHDVRIFERVDEQLITFAWPEHAAGVEFFTADIYNTDNLDFSDPDAIQNNPSVQHLGRISENQYRRRGGYQVNLQVPSLLILMPYRSHQGKTVPGKPTVLNYPGLLKMSYEIVNEAPAGAPAQLSVRIHANDRADTFGQSFVLMAQEGTLPIDPTCEDLQLNVWRRAASFGAPSAERQYAEKIFDIREPFTRDRLSGQEMPGESFAIDMNQLYGRRNIFLRLFLYTPSGGYQRVYEQQSVGQGEHPQPVPVLLDPPLNQLYYSEEAPTQQYQQQYQQSEPQPEPEQKESGGRFSLFRRKR